MDQHALPETCVDVQAASLSYAPCIVAGGLLPIHLTAEGELVPQVQQGGGRIGEGGGHDAGSVGRRWRACQGWALAPSGKKAHARFRFFSPAPPSPRVE